jgi:hypothetical protein
MPQPAEITQFIFGQPLSEADERLDPPSYLLRFQAGELIDSLVPIGRMVVEGGTEFPANNRG